MKFLHIIPLPFVHKPVYTMSNIRCSIWYIIMSHSFAECSDFQEHVLLWNWLVYTKILATNNFKTWHSSTTQFSCKTFLLDVLWVRSVTLGSLYILPLFQLSVHLAANRQLSETSYAMRVSIVNICRTLCLERPDLAPLILNTLMGKWLCQHSCE
jgi:hypothetical protein